MNKDKKIKNYEKKGVIPKKEIKENLDEKKINKEKLYMNILFLACYIAGLLFLIYSVVYKKNLEFATLIFIFTSVSTTILSVLNNSEKYRYKKFEFNQDDVRWIDELTLVEYVFALIPKIATRARKKKCMGISAGILADIMLKKYRNFGKYIPFRDSIHSIPSISDPILSKILKRIKYEPKLKNYFDTIRYITNLSLPINKALLDRLENGNILKKKKILKFLMFKREIYRLNKINPTKEVRKTIEDAFEYGLLPENTKLHALIAMIDVLSLTKHVVKKIPKKIIRENKKKIHETLPIAFKELISVIKIMLTPDVVK